MKLAKDNPYYNALQIKFAYAVTCHKSQGGQWERVFIDQGMFNRQEPTIDYLRWLYTALTRATDKVFPGEFPGHVVWKEMKGCKVNKVNKVESF